jgi:hypothetical protein
MREGLRRLAAGEWHAALGWFDAAIRERECRPWQTDSHAAWLLAGAWINRSDVLRRLEPPCLGAAMEALNEALRRLAVVDPAARTDYGARLVLAYLNRATLAHETGDKPAAERDFALAATVLEGPAIAAAPSGRLLRIMLAVNHAHVRMDRGEPAVAWAGLEAVTATVRQAREPDLTLRWCLAGCRALAALLTGPAPEPWLEPARRALREGLEWASALAPESTSARDLLRFGALFCRCHDRGFFSEFVACCQTLPGLLDDPARREDLAHSILLTIRDLELATLAGGCPSDAAETAIPLLKSLQLAHAAVTGFPS